MEGKASKQSSKGGYKTPSSVFGSAIPGSSRSGEEAVGGEDNPGGGLTMEAIGGRLLELEALVRSQRPQDGKAKRKEGQSEDFGEQGGIEIGHRAGTDIKRGWGPGEARWESLGCSLHPACWV